MTRISTSTKRKLQRIGKRQKRVAAEKHYRLTSPFFEFDASIRIGGAGSLHDAITSHTGLVASRSHLAGEPVWPGMSKICKEDLWILASPLDRNRPIDDHIDWLHEAVAPHLDFLSSVVKQAAWADPCLGCLSDVPYPMISTGASATRLIQQLDLAVAFNFTCR